LVEVVLVVSIIGIIAAIAVPRISSASAGASATALKATIEHVRNAIDRYYAEHGRYPGYNPATGLPNGTWFNQQMLKYSSPTGLVDETLNGPFRFGPYIRAPFPKNPFNHLDTVYAKATHADPSPADGSVGWVTVLIDGDFGISATDEDLDGVVESLDVPVVEVRETLRIRGP